MPILNIYPWKLGLEITSLVAKESNLKIGLIHYCGGGVLLGNWLKHSLLFSRKNSLWQEFNIVHTYRVGLMRGNRGFHNFHLLEIFKQSWENF